MVLRRLLALRQLSLFTDVDLAELVVIAENVVESTFCAGEQVAPAQERLASLHLITEGRIELRGDAAGVWSARDVMGLLEVLAGRPLPAPARAVVDTRTLELESADLFEILEDNFGVMASLIRTLATRCLTVDPGHRRVGGPIAPAPLSLVDRMVAIREHVPFLGARMRPLTNLAHAAREVTWLPGQVMTTDGEPTRDVLIVLDGEDAGSALGALEALAGAPQAATRRAGTVTRTLAIGATAIFDVLEDHTELGIATLAALASALLDAPPQGENATGTTIESNSTPVPSIACSTISSFETSTRT